MPGGTVATSWFCSDRAECTTQGKLTAAGSSSSVKFKFRSVERKPKKKRHSVLQTCRKDNLMNELGSNDTDGDIISLYAEL